ncbi:MAG: oxygen-dependent coproporphyrinogen oxidase [Geminicoccaceae bacterium]|nr:oxygen-dependent coproporphyrinogen oxidase [Geminicoccaceae bacterium]MCX7630011.1 oxygen-dependent coproporphyrinogen oxidase [Geminicoccaceae bacterium]MDW8124525.1 oxygen-dependent coproporphyrinogen oxidase [Geminicoccaceae bacterium]MDW8341347.1 oxygen-dependent coproporphyrinogen oxidase [Geminicoccaceae bacterium]
MSAETDRELYPESEDQRRVREWFESLRDRLCAAFEAIEDACGNPLLADQPPGRFERKAWRRPGGGGGVMAIMRGRVFEKVGVNVSTVWGSFAPHFAAQIPGAEQDPRFWASGVSLVAHPRSPLVPPGHMNTRHIRTTRAWFGGGADLNPIYPDAEDTARFHARLEAACALFAPDAYARFKKWADEYFFIPHRGEPRGVGGIFYDYLEGDFERTFAFTRAVGEAFLEVYPELVRRHMDRPWNEEQRRYQLVRRGRYVEFNLLYDRGTRFGLETGGNPEAVLMSLPPLVAWP